jgi:hypothetical protein
MRLAIIALAIVAGCSGGNRPQIKINPPPPKQTTGALAGPLCVDGVCKCRSGAADGGVGFPEDARKRFEVRLQSAYDLWVTLPGQVLYKSPEQADACFYVDLPPGKHPFELRASNPNGVSFDLEIRELGTKTKDWYDTFKFRCGHPGVCLYDELDGKKAEFAAVKRGLHDACGSTKIRSVIWDHGKSADNQYPSEIAMQLTLDVYKFPPWKKRGDPTCGEGGGRGPAGEDPAAEPEPATPSP